MIKELNVRVLCDDLAPFRSLALAQHGVSYFIEIKYEDFERRILFDTCSSYQVINYNSSLMNIDLKKIDAIVISHGHYDHGGGLRDLLNEINVPVFAHPTIFRENFYIPYLYIGIPKDHVLDLEKKNNFVFIREPLEIFPSVWTSGEVPRENKFEIVENMYTIQDGKIIRDPMMDDTSLYIDLGESIFLVSGCSHAGIVNIKKHGEKIFGKRVSHIIGGLHLLNAKEERINFTIENLADTELYLGHCTGENVINKFMENYGERVKRIYSSFELKVIP